MLRKSQNRRPALPSPCWKPIRSPDGISFLSSTQADRFRTCVLADKLPALTRKRGLALCEIARKASIPPGRLNDLRHGRPLSKREFERIAETLNVSIDRIFKRRTR
jgi:hypothetical protein